MPKNFSIPTESADFLHEPTELPSPETDFDAFLRQCNRQINQLICEAWKRGALPKRVALVQCLMKKLGRGRVDFRHPVIMKRDQLNEPSRVRLLAAFAHTTWHLTQGEVSAHARIRDYGDPSRGAMVIFTREIPGRPGKELWHTLHFGFPKQNWIDPLDFEDCRADLQGSQFQCEDELGDDCKQSFMAFDMMKFVQHANSIPLNSIIRGLPAPADWEGLASPAINASQPEKIRAKEGLLEKMTLDKHYRDRVAVLLHSGAIVICLPQTFRMQNREDENIIFDSGLTVVFEDDKKPTTTELRQIHAVTKKISLFIASTYGVANMLAHESQSLIARNIVSMISHSLKNNFTKASRTGAQLERIALLEMIKLDAASILFDPALDGKVISWDQGGFAEEPMESTIRSGLLENSQLVTLSATALSGKKLDARFIAIILELCHNLQRHSSGGSIHVTPVEGTSNKFNISVHGGARGVEADGLLKRIRASNVFARGKALRGWNFILMLTHALSEFRLPSLEIRFFTGNGRIVGSVKGTAGERQMNIEISDLPTLLPEKVEMDICFIGLTGTNSKP